MWRVWQWSAHCKVNASKRTPRADGQGGQVPGELYSVSTCPPLVASSMYNYHL